MPSPFRPGTVGVLLLSFLLMALVAGGCGGGSGNGTAAQDAPAGPCSLVTKSEVVAAVGTAVSDGAPENQAMLVGERACSFKTTDTQRLPVQVQVGIVSVYAPVIFSRYKAEHKDAVPVAKLGSEALWDDTRRALVVFEDHEGDQDDKVLTVVVFGAGLTDHRERAVRLATSALERA